MYIVGEVTGDDAHFHPSHRRRHRHRLHHEGGDGDGVTNGADPKVIPDDREETRIITESAPHAEKGVGQNIDEIFLR